MNIPKVIRYFLALMVFNSLAYGAIQPPKVAIMKAGSGGHNMEFDLATKNLGWEADYYDYNEEAHKTLSDNLSQYDFVITVPLFNWFRDESDAQYILPAGTVKDKFRNYIENGGIFIMTDAAYKSSFKWVNALGAEFEGMTSGKCNSSQWKINGYAGDAETPHPIRFFPNKITEPNSWPHFLEPDSNSKWKVIANCNEGFPVTVVQEFGKGLVVLSTLRHPTASQFENYYANALLVRSGVKIKDFSMSPLTVGEGFIDMKLASPVNQKAFLIYELLDENNHAERFEAEIQGDTCKMEFCVTKRCPVTASLILNVGKENLVLFSRTAVLPDLITLRPNTYRGILSTKRRVPTVNFYADIATINEDLSNAIISISVFNGSGSNVVSVEHSFSTNAIPKEVVIPMPLSKDLLAGEYTAKTTLLKDGVTIYNAPSETKFQILDPIPAQTIVDDDNTFLVNGIPFFPLGMYQAPPDSFQRLEEIGINSVVFWTWHLDKDEYGVSRNISKAMGHGFKIIFIMNFSSREIVIKNYNTLGASPALFMWYVWDEPSEGHYAKARMINDTYHEFDINHPTYALSCRTDIFREQSQLGDVFGHDPYGDPARVASWTENGVQSVDNRKATIPVLSSFDRGMAELYRSPIIMRANAYTAIAHDARGVFWYPWYQVGGGPRGVGLNRDEELQEMLKQVCTEIKVLFPGLLSTVRRPFKANDSVHGIVCGNQADKRFLIMVNLTDKPVEVNYTVDELARYSKVLKVRNPLLEDKTKNIEVTNGLISKTFEPYEVLVYNW